MRIEKLAKKGCRDPRENRSTRCIVDCSMASFANRRRITELRGKWPWLGEGREGTNPGGGR